MPGVYLIWLEAPEIAALARPGQFVMVRCGEGYDPLLRRPLSIHRLTGSTLALLFAVVGRGTEWLSRRWEGQALDIFGPLGNGFSIHQASKNLLLVAGGIGIAPVVALADEALARGCSATLLLGAENGTQIYPSHLLPSEPKLIMVTTDGSVGRKGLVTDLLPELAPLADQIFACGPIPMYKAMVALRPPIPEGEPVQVLLEQVLGCGRGICYGCTIETKNGPKQVCQDGPVFELREIIWESVVEPGVGKLVRL